MSDRLHTAMAVTERHAVMICTTQVNGEWWVQTSVDGVVLSYENIGPVDESQPPVPRATRKRRPKKTPS